MSNVNLKTDFKNGDKLMDHQLNNNFKAIQEALRTMNMIVWQDNADSVVTFRGTTEQLMNREIIDGQILYDTTTGESYIDYEGKRISTGSGNAIHIGDTEPTNPSTQIWINDDELSAVGSEVVNSLEGNEKRMAPSVDAVNNALFYKDGDTFKIPNVCYLNGQISGNSTQVLFSIVVPKLLTKIKSVTVNSYSISVRKVEGGYALNQVTSGVTFAVVKQLDNLLRFIVTTPEAMETTNNTPCGVVIYGLDLTFNE